MPDVEFYGEKFQLEDQPNEFALMQFAAAAEEVDVNSMAAMSAAFRLLQAAIVDEDWPRFKQTAFAHKATSETLMPVMFAVFEQATDRPTERPSVSSDGPEPTPLRSVSLPADPAMDRLSGRPDLQSAVLEARKAARSA